MIVSVPLSASWTLPETGASSIAAPSARACSASARLAPGLTVLMSTQIFPAVRPARSPSEPAAIVSSAASSVTMLNTTSAVSATSRGVSRQTRPRSSSGSALALVRFQPTSGWPEASRRPATRPPIAPRPTNPIVVMPPASPLHLRSVRGRPAVSSRPAASMIGVDLVGAAEADDRAVDSRVAQRPGDSDRSRGRSMPFGNLGQAADAVDFAAAAAVSTPRGRICPCRGPGRAMRRASGRCERGAASPLHRLVFVSGDFGYVTTAPRRDFESRVAACAPGASLGNEARPAPPIQPVDAKRVTRNRESSSTERT